jgi:hypothetical protein
MEPTLLRQDKEWEIHKIKSFEDKWYIILSHGETFTFPDSSGRGVSETLSGLKIYRTSNDKEGNLIAVKKAIKPVKTKVRK